MREMTRVEIGLKVSSGVGKAGTNGVVGVIDVGTVDSGSSSGPSGIRGPSDDLDVMVMSAHARNSSWGPHPTAPVPFLQSPQLLPVTNNSG